MVKSRPVSLHAAPLISLGLIACLWADRQLFHLPVGDPAVYHEAVRLQAEQLPYRIGPWVGEDAAPPPSATALLKPNVLRGRRFRNTKTGESATLIIVQCRDARDMGGHYPPKCYPAQGWSAGQAEARTIRVGPLTIPLAVYGFTFDSPEYYSEIVIYNFFVRPDGIIERGTDGAAEAAADPRLKGYGAAQIQVVFDVSMKERRRDEVFGTLIEAALPLLSAIREGTVR